MISEANIFDYLNTKVHICDTIGNTIICKHSTCCPNTIENIVYLTKIIGVERIEENICIDANPSVGFAIKAKNEAKRIALTCQGIT
jgi:hypothetical protein